MKRKTSISKSIAALLCIIAMTISLNIYLSYKDLFLSNNLSRDSIIYAASAKTSLDNSTISTSDTAIPSIKSKEVSKETSITTLNRLNIYNKIFINILILFLSFISLASVHNYILNVEKSKECDFNNNHGLGPNRKTNIKSSSSLISKEGAQ